MKPSRIIITAIAIFLFGIGGCATNGYGTGDSSQSKTKVNTTSAAPSPTPLATPSPNGTYSGSCDYTLTSNYNNPNDNTLIGEVDLTNTGNIGTITKVIITWPQEGFNPIRAVKKVQVKAGGTMPVRFHVSANDTIIGQLQSWQEGHNMNSGCTYKATITGTYGKVK